MRDRDRQAAEPVELELEVRHRGDEAAHGEQPGRPRAARAERERPRHHRALGEAAEHRALDRDAGALREPLEPGAEALERRQERLRVRVADLLDQVPVVADRRQLQRAAGERADEPLARVEDVEQRDQVLLGGAASVQQHDRAGGLALGRPQLVYEIVDVSHERGRYSVRRRWTNRSSSCCCPGRSSASISSSPCARCCARRASSPSTRRGFPLAAHAGDHRGRRSPSGQARRMRLPGTPAAVRDPPSRSQFFLAGALLARHPARGALVRPRRRTTRATRSSTRRRRSGRR